MQAIISHISIRHNLVFSIISSSLNISLSIMYIQILSQVKSTAIILNVDSCIFFSCIFTFDIQFMLFSTQSTSIIFCF